MNGKPPEPFERGPKDVVRLEPDQTIRVAMRFGSRFTGTYVFRCHNLSHEDNMMTTRFEVVPRRDDPGSRVGEAGRSAVLAAARMTVDAARQRDPLPARR